MPLCKYCNVPFSWGNTGEKFVPLVPIGEDEGMDRSYQDENGLLRAEHAQVCINRGGPAVRITRLQVTVPGENVMPRRFVDDDDDGGSLYAAACGPSSRPDPLGPPKRSRKRSYRSQ